MNSETKLIKSKVDLLNLAEQLNNVTRACKLTGTSRDSFYRIKQLYDRGGEEVLREMSRRKPIPKNRVDPAVEEAVVKIAFDYPAYGNPALAMSFPNKVFLFLQLVSGVYGNVTT